AMLAAAGKGAAGVVSASAAALAESVLKTMLMAKVKTAAALMLAVGIVVFGASTVGRSPFAPGQALASPDKKASSFSRSEGQNRSGTEPGSAKVKKPSANLPLKDKPKTEEKLTVTGRVLDHEGKSIANARVAVVAWLKFAAKNGEPM